MSSSSSTSTLTICLIYNFLAHVFLCCLQLKFVCLFVYNFFFDLQTKLQCSAKNLDNLSEIFYYAQKTVLYPVTPIYYPEERDVSSIVLTDWLMINFSKTQNEQSYLIIVKLHWNGYSPFVIWTMMASLMILNWTIFKLIVLIRIC